MSLLLPESGTLFWMLLSFGIVFVILAKYGFPIIVKMVEDRKAYIDQSMEVARESNAKLAKIKEEEQAVEVLGVLVVLPWKLLRVSPKFREISVIT